jgi:diaminopropionate ammonia-lyase
MRALVNDGVDLDLPEAPSEEAVRFHTNLPGYAPTPMRRLQALAAELGLGEVLLKDETDRFGLPSFKVLGASWAVELMLRERPDTRTLIAASAGNHGQAVAHVARLRGLRCRVFLPARATPARRAAIAAEGADLVIIDGPYERAVVCAQQAGRDPATATIADVGVGAFARWVIDGYASLFAEVAAQTRLDLLLVPGGVGSLAAAAARFAARADVHVLAIEPETAACLSASLEAGAPVSVPTPGTVMAGLDCAEVSAAAWASLLHGIDGTITVSDDEAQAAVRELAATGHHVGASGAAPLAGLRVLCGEPKCSRLRRKVGLGPDTHAVLLATEGVTDPDAYAAALQGSSDSVRFQDGCG